MTITIDRKILNAFRHECRKAYPKEHLAVLHGARTTDGITITKIVAIPHTADENQARYDRHQIFKSKIKALKAEDDWLGTIHSHTWTADSPCCEHPSDSDNITALENGETIMAIVFLWAEGTRSSVHWYVPQQAPVVVLS